MVIIHETSKTYSKIDLVVRGWRGGKKKKKGRSRILLLEKKREN